MRCLLLTLSLIVTGLVVTTHHGAALAQTMPPDIVQLKDGGLLRGTIAETVAGEYVVMVLLTGETRRIDYSTVRYAGPVADRPAMESAKSSSDTVPSSPSTGARLRLLSGDSGQSLTFYKKTGEAVGVAHGVGGSAYMQATSFRKLCVAPCEITVPVGREVLALSIGTNPPVAVEDRLFDLKGDMTLRGHYQDDWVVRKVGFGLIVVGSLLSGGLLWDATSNAGNGTAGVRNIGWGFAIGSILGGLWLGGDSDNADIEVVDDNLAR